MKNLKVTLDTNVIVSGMILERGIPYLILELWRRGAFLLITSTKIIEEVIEVLYRAKKVKHYEIPLEKLTAIKKLLQQKSRIVIPTPFAQTIPLRDKKNAFILETAISGKADYLVSGDKDLISLHNRLEIKPLIITIPQQFLELLRGTVETKF